MVADGHAWVYRKYNTDRSFREDEARARKAKRGLRSSPHAIAPWDWHRGARSQKGVGRLISRGKEDAAEPECGSRRHCREMRTCAEAKYHLERFGLTRLDGDGDGIPCETICRDD
ncbi:MAG: hypothetical protein CMD83_18730 [Gammaproteobacteria bacterium]|nr:hypothetical protein [Gammaproteobacteria bacterium]